jgi:phosphoribosylaminoimidazolecarboxamide formyltransferase/IMP cyclohydrolase
LKGDIEMIKRALISVYNKKGLRELVQILGDFDVEIVSSGGTAKKIKEIGYDRLVEVSEFTGHPESPDGLLKTLHPKIHGGILLNRDIPEHQRFMKRNNIKPFDLVVVNLYPFEKVIAEGVTFGGAIKNIDIGGPTLIRAAAKASLLYNKMAIVIDPAQYQSIGIALKENNGIITQEHRGDLALKAFKRTTEYDAAISNFLNKV